MMILNYIFPINPQLNYCIFLKFFNTSNFQICTNSLTVGENFSIMLTIED